MMKFIGLAQARMGSSRLPGKVMKSLAGMPLVGHIFDRLEASQGLDGLVLATTSDPRNAPLVAYARDRAIPVVQHPEEDEIIGRLLMAADATGADAFVKVNADCPLIDPAHISAAIQAFAAAPGVDFASNKLSGTLPLGFSIELVSVATLRHCDRILREPEHRELVIKWIIDHPDDFRHLALPSPRSAIQTGLMVDTPDEFELMTRIFADLYPQNHLFGLPEVEDWCARNAIP